MSVDIAAERQKRVKFEFKLKIDSRYRVLFFFTRHYNRGKKKYVLAFRLLLYIYTALKKKI